MKARISASSWVAVWLAEQNLAGLDIVTDGEQRRRHYNWGFLEALGEVDFENLGLRSSRGQRYTEETKAPRLRTELAWPGPVMREPFEFARARTDRTIKVTLPRPMTLRRQPLWLRGFIDQSGNLTGDGEAVAVLWRVCEQMRPWNDTLRDIGSARANASSDNLRCNAFARGRR